MFQGYSQNLWVNLLGFNLIWWLCILYGDKVLLPVSLLLLLHLLLHRTPVIEMMTLFICGGLGFAVDSLLTLAGVFRFESSSILPPLWLALLWLSFTATLRQSLRWFRGRYRLAACAGALAGSTTYLAAAQLEPSILVTRSL
ncbi:MAG: DUF2878 domain-containing protein [Motiliproteus sp.]|nr:DUF2878 domain-containing protein [Motiliproteus sp.]